MTTASFPRSSDILLYTGVWLVRARRFRRRAGAPPSRPREPGLNDLPLPLLHARRAGRRGVRPRLALHARPGRQPRLVPAAPRVRGAAVRPVDRARAPAVHLRDDRVLDRRRRLDSRYVRRTEYDPARSRGGRAHRRGRPVQDRTPAEAAADPQVDRLHGRFSRSRLGRSSSSNRSSSTRRASASFPTRGHRTSWRTSWPSGTGISTAPPP